MKHLLSITTILLLAATLASAQERTEETVTTTDTTGRTTTVSITTVSKTEDITPRNDVILMSPFEFIRFYNISYLHSFTPNLAGGGGFKLSHDLADDFDETKVSFGLTLEGRFYPGKKGVRGFYVAPITSLNWLAYDYGVMVYNPQTGRETEQPRTATGLALTAGLTSGWQFFPWEEMTMGVGLGFERRILVTSGAVSGATGNFNTRPFEDYDSKTWPTVRLDIGYAW